MKLYITLIAAAAITAVAAAQSVDSFAKAGASSFGTSQTISIDSARTATSNLGGVNDVDWKSKDCPPVPEPASMLALLSGCGILLRKKFKK